MKKIFLLVALSLFSLCFLSACKDKKEEAPRAAADYSWFDAGLKNYVATVPGFKIPGNNVSATEPAILFGYSYYLFDHAMEERAIFVFYLAQLRGRILLEAMNKPIPISNAFFEKTKQEAGIAVLGQQVYLGPMTRKELYPSFFNTLGYVINTHASKDVNLWMNTMQDVLDYENAHPFAIDKLIAPDNLFSESEIKNISTRQKNGLAGLIVHVKQKEKEFATLHNK